MNAFCTIRHGFIGNFPYPVKALPITLSNYAKPDRRLLSKSVFCVLSKSNISQARSASRCSSSCSFLKYRQTKHNIHTANSIVASKTTKTDAEKLEEMFPLRYIFVQTSVTRWMEFQDGVTFDAGYVECVDSRTKRSSIDDRPVILGIPNVIGDHNELTSVLKPFAAQGYRVVIVNLPGSQYCRGKNKIHERVYQMSVTEHVEFITDFLYEMNIDKVNMVVTNGHSVYTGVNLCAVHKDMFHSLAMLNPTGNRHTKLMNFPRLHKWIGHFFESKSLITQYGSRGFVNIFKNYMMLKNKSYRDVSTFSRNMMMLSFVDNEHIAQQLRIRGKPLLACFGADSDYLDVQSTIEYLSLMGIDRSVIVEVKEEKQQIPTDVTSAHTVAFHVNNNTEHLIEDNLIFIRRRLWNFYMANNKDAEEEKTS